MKNISFSIIVPTYNSADRIQNSIKRLLSMPYTNYEVIAVNDGSMDGTGDLLYKIKSNKLRVISVDNKGVSVARNIGVKAATGDYILFVDDDDELSMNALSVLNDSLQKMNYPNLLRFSGYREAQSGDLEDIKNFDNKKSGHINSEKAIRSIVNPKEGVNCYVWLLAVRNENVCCFNSKLRYLEDEDFYINSLLMNKTIAYIDDKLYIYKFNKNSKTKNPKKFKDNINDIVLARNTIIEKLNKKEQKLYDSKIVHLVYRRLCYYMSLYETKREKRIATKYAKEAIYANNIRSSLVSGLKGIVERFLITEPTGVILSAWRTKRK